MKDEHANPKFEILPPEKPGKHVIITDAYERGTRNGPYLSFEGLPETVTAINKLITDHSGMAWFALVTSATLAMVMALTQAADTPVALEWFNTLAIANG